MSSSRRKWIGATAAVALVAVGVVVLTSRDQGSASDKDLIITAAVKRQTLQDKVTLSGTLGRVEQRKVNAPAEGRISRTYLDDGADVQPGQAILAIDGRDAVAEPGDFPFYRQLDVGAQGPDVNQLEKILAAAGYNPGPIDELYTEQTRFALAQWQADHNYPGAASRTAKTVTVSLQPNGNGYKIGPQNTAAVTIGPDLGTPSGPVGRARPRQSGGGLPRLSIRALSQKTQEGTPAQFIVEVDRDITQPIDFTVNLSGTASEADVVAPVGTITIPVGARQVPLNIPTIADGIPEGDEELTVNLADGDTYDLGDSPAATTVITSPNDLPEITMTGGGTVAEGGKVTLAVSGGNAGGDVQVMLQITGTATSGTDYNPITPVVTLNSASSATFDVQTLTDSIIEPDETIIVSVAQSPNYKVGKISTAVITIQGATGDAAKPVLTLSPLTTSVTEGSPINFSLSANSAVAADVELLLQFSGTASDGIDYLRPAGRLVLPAGQSSMQLSVPTVQDDLVEPDEVVSVALAPSDKYNVGNPSGGTVTIQSDDLPELQLVGGTVRVLGGSASRLAIVADQPPSQDTTVNYSVQGSAQPGQDFQPLTGTVVLHKGQTSVGVAVQTVNEDVTFHPTDMIVGTWPTRLGQMIVDEGQFVPAGTALFSLTDSGFTVTLKATASDRTKLQLGQQVTATLVGGTETAQGTISALDENATVNKDTGEQTYEGKVELQGDLGAADGALVTLDVVIQEKTDVLTVPIAAVKQNGQGQDVVRVIDLDHGGKVTEVPVTTGLSEGSFIEISQGLKGDEVVIVEVDTPKP
jgi:multidrug efflux pump subunit AcrA (membrane-fusion protein)